MTATSSLTTPVSAVLHHLQHKATPGVIAQLRRDANTDSPGLTFYRVAASVLPAGWESSQESWQAIVGSFALLGPSAHVAGQPLGKALAKSGYSEIRLNRFLNTPPDLQAKSLLSVARYLSAKGAKLDFLELAQYVLTTTPEKREALRRRIATAYFTNA